MGLYTCCALTSPKSRSPWVAAMLLTVTTRADSAARNRSSSRPVNAKWPKWFVPNCNSKPSLVSCRCGGVMTPALLIRMSIGRPSAVSSSPSVATLGSDDRSSCRMLSLAWGTSRRISAIGPFALRPGRGPPSPRRRPRPTAASPGRNPDRCWPRSLRLICHADPERPVTDRASPCHGQLVEAVGQRVMFEWKVIQRHGKLQSRNAAQQRGQDDL